MTQLNIFLLGIPRFELDGVNITLDTRKASALLAYLAIVKQRQSRDALAALLWPEFDQSHARATLRRTLSTLNKALGGSYLEISREYINLDFNAGIWVDVDEFHKRLSECRSHVHLPTETCSKCLEPLSAAVELYGGDFLTGFSLRDSSNFDDWQFYQADTLRRDFTGALERLVHCYISSGNFEAAITRAQQWLALDRLNESAHRLLMQLYAWNDQQSAALHQYRECIQVLNRELGVGPLESTTSLYQAIKEHQIAPFPASKLSSSKTAESRAKTFAHSQLNTFIDAATPAVPLTFQPGYPFVGRSQELMKLKQVYNDINTTGHLILLEGEAGIGKTRLAEEFLSDVQSKGAIVISARCYEGETQFAFGPVVAGLHTTLALEDTEQKLKNIPLPWISEAARLLPELNTYRTDLLPLLPLDSPGGQSRFFEGLKQVLYALCKSEVPGIIFFDDIQWADSATLDLLNYLVRRLREQPVCLLVTLRNRDTSNGSHLHQLQNEALRAGNATVLSLSRLDFASVRELVLSAHLDNKVLNNGFVDRLFQETEGLPFFLIEYLLAITSGILVAESEHWSPPGSVRELLNSRLKAVSETGKQLLGAAAIIGRSFDFDTLREVSGRGEEETVNALEELIAQGLVVEVDMGEKTLKYDFSHERLRSLVYEETSLARRRLLHRRVAETFIRHTRENHIPGSLAGQIAYHYDKSGNEVIAAEYFKQAGDYARSLYANAEALTHYRTALALGFTDTVVLHENIGDLYTLMGEYTNAIKSYETAATLCAPTALASEEHKLGNVYERLGEWDLAESHYVTTLDIYGQQGSEGERAKVYADWSLAAYHRGQIEHAISLAQQSLDLAENAQDTRALAQVHNILGVLATNQQKLEEAQQHLEQSLALAEELDDLSIRIAVLNNLALVCKSHGEIERAITLTQDALALCESQGDLHREAALYSNLADLFHEKGNAEVAMRYLKQSVSIFAEIGEEFGSMRPEIWKLVEW